MASKDHLDDVKREVMVVGELVDILSGEQKYLQRKLERHIKTVVRAPRARRAARAALGLRRPAEPARRGSATAHPAPPRAAPPRAPPQKSNNSRTFWYTALEVTVLLLVTGVNLAVTTGFFKGGPVRITV